MMMMFVDYNQDGETRPGIEVKVVSCSAGQQRI